MANSLIDLSHTRVDSEKKKQCVRKKASRKTRTSTVARRINSGVVRRIDRHNSSTFVLRDCIVNGR